MTTVHHNSAPPSPPLGATVRKYRERAGLSIRQLAATAEVNYAYLSRIENGIYTNPGADLLQRIAEALDIDPAKLLRFIGVKPSTKQATRAKGLLPTRLWHDGRGSIGSGCTGG